ncbi:MAG: hypothetical protein R3C19_03265 [Planctomycetaceae bacterium]
MKTEISQLNENFIQTQIANGVFPDRQSALNAAVELLRRRSDVLERIDTGRRQLDAGDFTEYDDDTLRQRLDDLKSRAQDSIRDSHDS